ncbi:MAG: nitroreductase family protein, partial [Halanaerobiales bacterium]
SFQDREVEEDKLERVLNAGRLAPSGKNVQGWKFIVTRDEELKQKLVKACSNQKFVGEADCVITVCVDETKVYQYHGDYMTSFAVDGAIAMDHMMLAAAAEGLGTCWIGAYIEDEVREVLNVPQPYRIIGLTPLGYPNGSGKDRGRKPLEDIVFWETWTD